MLGRPNLYRGQFAGGERKTAEEVRLVGNAALSRLEKSARLISIQAMLPLGYMLASQTQQFLREEQWIRFVGRNEADLAKHFGGDTTRKVSPRDIRVAYDLSVTDGSLPDRGDANLLVQVIQMAAQSPEMFAEFDIGRLLRYALKSSGFTNVEDFVKDPNQQVTRQVLPDEEVVAQAGRGELAALGT